MNAYNRVLRMSLTLGMLGAISGATNTTAQTVTPEEAVRSVRKMVERLPYFGVFDFIVFRVDRGARSEISPAPNWATRTVSIVWC